MKAIALRILLASTFISFVLVSVAILAGRFIEPDTMIANATTAGTSVGEDDHEVGLYYVDLNKMVSVYVQPPLENTVAIVSQYGMSFNQYYVITNHIHRREPGDLFSTYGIHRWNPRTQALETLFSQEGDRVLRISDQNTIRFTYNRSSGNFIFYDHIDEWVYAYYDGNIIPTVSLEESYGFQHMELSPQGDKFLYAQREPVDGITTDRLFIFDLETMTSSEIEHNFVRFERTYYYWHSDNDIIFSRHSEEEQGIRRYIIDEAAFDSRFDDADGIPRQYREYCGGDWLAYDTYEDGRRYYYLRNLDTGEEYDYNDSFPLDRKISQMYFSEDCETINITATGLGEIFPAFTDIYRVRRDADDGVPQQLIEAGRLLYADRENTLVYVTEDGDVYQNDYDPSTAPTLLGTINEEIVGRWNLSYIKGGYLTNAESNDWQNMGRLILRDIDSGGEIALTDENYNIGFHYVYPAGGWDFE